MSASSLYMWAHAKSEKDTCDMPTCVKLHLSCTVVRSYDVCIYVTWFAKIFCNGTRFLAQNLESKAFKHCKMIFYQIFDIDLLQCVYPVNLIFKNQIILSCSCAQKKQSV